MLKSFFIILLLISFTLASDHGIYLKTVNNVNMDFDKAVNKIETEIQSSEYQLLSSHKISTPQLIGQKCTFRARLFLLENKEYTGFLTSYANKYLIASLLKVGLYQDEKGTHVVITDPETINRIVFNDLPESTYKEVVSKTKKFKAQLIGLIHGLKLGQNVQQPMEPVRSDEDLWEASKDMFMMVGPMTFFQDEDQFPLIHEIKNVSGTEKLNSILEKVKENLASFSPSENDRDYQKSKNAGDLQWKILGTVHSPDSRAALIGITRPRTEALSFHIAGQSRISDQNQCPGIDHLCSYPVEVLFLQEKGKVAVYTAREMFRMDMYFWDAGKMAFMKYMNMPKMLDKSIKKALFKLQD